MIKRMMILAGMALAAVAFAAPAAQAEVYLHEKGTKLKKGAIVTATSSNLVTILEAPGATLHCAQVKLKFELTDPGTKQLKLKQLEAAQTTGCTYEDPEKSFPATIAEGFAGAGEGNVVTVNTWGTANTQATFITELFADQGHTTKISECHFAGQLHLVAKGVTSDELNVTPSTLVGTPPSCGHGLMQGDFTLETANKVPVEIHYKATP